MPKYRLPELKSTFWIKKDLLYADITRLKEAMGDTPEFLIQKRLGAAYKDFLGLLEGKGVDHWTAYFIENSFGPETPIEPNGFARR